MKKIIFFSALIFAIIAGTIISCTKNQTPKSEPKSDIKRQGQLMTTNSKVVYPIVTKYQKAGISGEYNLVDDVFIRALKDGGAFDEVAEAYITYYYDNADKKDRASMVIIGRKNATAIAHQFELLVNGDGYFVVQDPDNNTIQSHTNYSCSGNCNNCNFTRDANRNITGCTSCQGGTCVFNKTVNAQDGMSTSDGIAGASLVIAIIALLIAL